MATWYYTTGSSNGSIHELDGTRIVYLTSISFIDHAKNANFCHFSEVDYHSDIHDIDYHGITSKYLLLVDRRALDDLQVDITNQGHTDPRDYVSDCL